MSPLSFPSLSFAYDLDDNRTLVADSFDGTQLSTYDKADRLASLTYSGESQNLSETLGYYGGGEVSAAALYSGSISIENESYGLGPTDEVTSLVDLSYGYNPGGQITAASVNGGVTTSYAYDPAGQVAGAGAQSYTYDASGNPTNGGTDSTGNDNRLQTYVDPTTGDTWYYDYDQVGNRIEAFNYTANIVWNYTYNNANQMTTATETSGASTLAVVVYKYDAFGNMIEEDSGVTSASTVAKYAVDGWNPANQGGPGLSNFTVWAVLNSDDSLQTRQLFSVGTISGAETTPLVRIDQTGASDPSGVYWTLTDRLGSVSYVLNNTAGDAPVDAAIYNAFGLVAQTTSSYLGLYGWDSYVYDPATQVYVTGAREYDPISGRWEQQDPMGFEAGDPNLYRYVDNMPTNETDPSGLLFGLGEPRDWSIVRTASNYADRAERAVGNAITRASDNISQSLAPVVAAVSNPQQTLDAVTRDVERRVAVAQQTVGQAYDDFATLNGRVANRVTNAAARAYNECSMVGNYVVNNPGETLNIYSDSVLNISLPAAGNALVDSLANFATCGNAGQLNLFSTRPQDQDLVNFAYGWSRFGFDLLGGVALGQMGPIGQVHNLVSSAQSAGQAAADIYENGLNLQNSLALLSGLANAGGAAATLRGANCASALTRAGAAIGGVTNVVGAGANIYDIYNNGFTTQNTQGLVSNLTGAYSNWQLGTSCFSGDTQLMAHGPWGSGWRRIDEIALTDEVLSRLDGDPNGPLEWKKVEELFKRFGRIVHLHVGGQLIKTTGEHPFYVFGEGWIAAGALQRGDLLSSHDGQWGAVEDVFDTGEFETVYNVQIADFHTYFVGCQEWAFPGQCGTKLSAGAGAESPGTL